MKPTLPYDESALEEHIERLASILDRHTLTHIEYHLNDTQIILKKTSPAPQVLPYQVTDQIPVVSNNNKTVSDNSKSTTAYDVTSDAADFKSLSSDSTYTSAPDPTLDSTGTIIRAPIIGVAYRSKDPDTPAFVKVGDTVKEGTTLCLIEAMKMFNEITSSVGGVVSEIHFRNAELVEHGAPLFTIT